MFGQGDRIRLKISTAVKCKNDVDVSATIIFPNQKPSERLSML